MERRKILLGSSGALATALAGCFGSETDGDDDGSDGDTGSSTENGTDDEPEDNGDESEPEDDSTADIPGLDLEKLDVKSDAVTVESVERTGKTVSVVAETEITDHEKLYAELETLGDDHEKAVTDLEKLTNEIETIEWTIDHKDKNVVSFTVKVQWIVEYHEGELSEAQFAEKVKSTAE